MSIDVAQGLKGDAGEINFWLHLKMNMIRRSAFFACIHFLCSSVAYAQTNYIDSLKKLLPYHKEDTNKVNLLSEIGTFYLDNLPDTSIAYAQNALRLANKLHYEPGILNAELTLSYSFTTLGNYSLAIDFGFKALSLAKKAGRPLEIIWSNARLAQCYFYQGDFSNSLQYDREIFKVVEKHFPDSVAFIYTDLSKVFANMGQPDSAYYYAVRSYEQIKKWHYDNWYTVIYPVLGNAYIAVKKYDSALLYFNSGIAVCVKNNSKTDLVDIYNGIASVFNAMGKRDSATWYAKKVFTQNIAAAYPNGLLKAATILTEIYQSKNKSDSTLKYLRIATGIKDSLFNREKTIAIQNLVYKEQEKQKGIEAARLRLQTQFRMFFLGLVLVTVIIIAIVLFRNRRLKQIQTMRNSIADDLHDDIGSALSSISIMNELAKSKASGALPLLNSIGENAAAIQENMSDIVWAVNPQNDVFANVLQRMNQFASEILDTGNVELEFINDESLNACKLSMEKRKNFYLFFKEVINNAAKYAAAKKITVHLSKKENFIEMNVVDDGKGFDTGQVFNTNGMNTLKRRAAELNASFSITSQLNSGTQVHLKFKIT